MEPYGSEHNFMQLSSIFENHWIMEPEVSFFSDFDGLIGLSYFNIYVKLYWYFQLFWLYFYYSSKHSGKLGSVILRWVIRCYMHSSAFDVRCISFITGDDGKISNLEFKLSNLPNFKNAGYKPFRGSAVYIGTVVCWW